MSLTKCDFSEIFDNQNQFEAQLERLNVKSLWQRINNLATKNVRVSNGDAAGTFLVFIPHLFIMGSLDVFSTDTGFLVLQSMQTLGD